MNRKNIGIVIGAGGLMAAAFFAGSVLMKDGSASTKVIAGGVTPAVTSTVEPSVTATVEAGTNGGVVEVGGTTSSNGTDSGGASSGGGSSNGGDSNGGSQGNQGEQPQQGGEGQGQQLPQPQPQPEPQSQPQPEPQPQPQPEPEVEEPAVLNARPFVTQVTPAHNMQGVAIGTNIVVKFSEPMDKASAEAAFSIQPAVLGSFSWDAEGKVMTFNPAVNFAYNAAPAWKLTNTAKDASGLTMKNEYNVSFSVLKTTKVFLKGQAAFDGTVFAPPVAAPDKVIVAGNTFSAGTWQRGFISFDLSALPDDLIKLESAELNVYQDAHTAGAYTAQTGSLMLQSVSYGTLDIGDWGKAMNQFCLPGCANLQQVFSSSAADGWKNADVLGMVSLDWANREARGDRSQFRLAFQNENNGGGPNITATFVSGSNMVKVPVLEVVYVHK